MRISVPSTEGMGLKVARPVGVWFTHTMRPLRSKMKVQGREPRTREALAQLVDASVLREALAG